MGTEKISKIGFSVDVYTVIFSGAQLYKILINPKQYPINKLPESPKYNFAGGKLKNKKPPIAQSRRIEMSVNLYWFR